jgi:hypothetical protein
VRPVSANFNLLSLPLRIAALLGIIPRQGRLAQIRKDRNRSLSQSQSLNVAGSSRSKDDGNRIHGDGVLLRDMVWDGRGESDVDADAELPAHDRTDDLLLNDDSLVHKFVFAE